MTPTKNEDTTVRDLISTCNKLIESNAKVIEMFAAAMAQNAETIRVMRDQNDILRENNKRTETFLFIGDPAKNVPSFVSEVRDGLGDHSGAIKRAQEAWSKVVWTVVLTFLAGAAGALMWWKPMP